MTVLNQIKNYFRKDYQPIIYRNYTPKILLAIAFFLIAHFTVIGQCTTPTNLALNKSATQSSQYGDGLASIAVDGDTDGTRGPWGANASINSTQNDLNAWWEVDLGEVSQIDEINVWNRTDCCADRLNDFHVLVSDVAFTSTDLNTTINQNGVSNFFISGTAGSPTIVSVNRTGRFVRVQLSDANFLHMAELEVMGCASTSLDQTITFDAISDKLTTSPPFTLSAAASSGLPVNYSITSGPATVSGNIVTLSGTTGTVVVKASQAGDGTYNPAPDVEQSFAVNNGNNNPTNLALNKSATQSSQYGDGLASIAVDGDTDGTRGPWGANASINSTQNDLNAWWEVDLGEVSQIDEINVWNRTDCCTGRLNDFHVLVSDVAFTSTDLNTTINQNGVSNFFISGTAGSPTIVSVNRTGRYVRVQLSDANFLHMAEVEVIGSATSMTNQTITFDAIPDKLTTSPPFTLSAAASSGLPVNYSITSGPATVSGNTVTLNGTTGTVVVKASQAGDGTYNPAPDVEQSFAVNNGNNNPTNLALNKSATQSSQYGDGLASIAVDGDTDGTRGPWGANASINSTQNDLNAWWEVDLGEVSQIDEINVWNRTDCCADRLNDFHVLVSDVAFTSTDLNTTINQNGVSNFFISGTAGSPTIVSVNRTGRYVRVQLSDANFLHMAEVEVMGTELGSVSNGLYFENDYVSVPNNPAYNIGTGDFTFEAMVNSDGDNAPDANIILSNRSFRNGGFADGFLFGIIRGGKLFVQIDGEINTISSSENLFDNSCHHLAAVRENGSITFYVDGVEINTLFNDRSIGNPRELWIGHDFPDRPTFNPAFTGSIKEVRMWNVSRTSQEISDDINQSLQGNEIGLIGYWPMLDGQGQVVADLSPTGNNGRLGAQTGVDGADPQWVTTCSLESPQSFEGAVANQIEFNALRDLYENTDGDNWTAQNDTYVTDDWPRIGEWDNTITLGEVDSWHGMKVENGDITNLGVDVNGSPGQIPASIGNLNGLEDLRLRGLTGTIPNELGNLSNLKVLGLTGGQLIGSIPDSFTNLTELIALALNETRLSGNIPPFLGGLTKLQELSLIDNQFSGSLPSEIGNLEKLQYLILQDNQLTGPIPNSFSGMTSLDGIILSNNQLSGSIPSFLGTIPDLNSIFLDNNQFTAVEVLAPRLNSDLISWDISGNQLGFSTLEPNYNPDGSHIFGELLISPQNSGPIEVIPANAGQNITLDATDGQFTQYQWQYGVNGAWSDIFGATSPTFTDALGPDQLDLHIRCKKTNTRVSGVTIYSQEFVLQRIGFLPNLAENLPDATSTAPQPDGMMNKPGFNNVIPNAINYVRSYTARVDGLTDPTQLAISSPVSSVQASTQYIDGLGRPMQTVIRKESPDGSDIVQPIVYDAFGRNEKQYLPYTHNEITSPGEYRPNALLEQYNFYHASDDAIADTDYPFSQNGFEASPLNRLLCQAAPGENWRVGSGHELKFTFRSNNLGEDGTIPIWEIDQNTLRPVTTADFADAELFVNQTADEHGNMVIEFTDKRGRVMLKKVEDIEDNMGVATSYLFTYYVYDDFDNLRAVIPPQAVKELNQGASLDEDFKDQWLFIYKYDHRQRMVEKKVPGADGMRMVYNKRDQLVLAQDGNQVTTNEWIFTKYDALNRPIMTGIITDGRTLAQIQAEIDGQAQLYETSVTTGGLLGYSNTSFPAVTDVELLAVTYYDDYNFPHGSDLDLAYFVELSNPATPYANSTGLVTGGLTRVLSGTSWLRTISYYDDYGRLLQTFADNNLGDTDRVTSKYDFVGNVLETLITYRIGTPDELAVSRVFNYDDADRLVKVDHQVGAEPVETLAQNIFNELGELTQKDLGQDDLLNPLQTVDYQYNIRGWLTHINDADLTDPNDHFGMELFYDYGYEDNEFNGNIAGVKWQSALDTKARTYGYLYDPVNRIKGAAYAAKSPAGWDQEFNNYCIGNIDYDGNGNILKLQRNGRGGFDTSGNPLYSIIDDLVYDYSNSGNQLQAVNDLIANGPKDRGDFYDGSETAIEYGYDDNGNMTSDANKEISTIDYNYLNLPETVTFADGNQIKYTYDAAGIKHKQEVLEGGNLTKTTDYLGELIYEDGALAYVQHEEGRAVPKATGGYQYQFYHKDHLGNIRQTFTGDPITTEYNATMEPAASTEEEASFSNIAETRHPEDLMSVSGLNSARLNGSQGTHIGPAKSLAVGKGDKLDISVYAGYKDGTGNSSSSLNLAGLINAVAGSFGGVNGGTTSEQFLYNAVDVALNLFGLAGANPDTDVPRAYVQYIFFDENFLPIPATEGGFGYLQVSSAGAFINNVGTHELLQFSQIVVPETGYVYIYVSNESVLDVNVFFDDLKVSHTEGEILQEDHYYPFGLTLGGLGKQGSNPFKYNGIEEQDELNLGVFHATFRTLDPALGRWWQIDPAVDEFYSWTPYNSNFNNPIRYSDPDGDCPIPGLDCESFAKGLWNSVKSAGEFVADVWNSKGRNIVQSAENVHALVTLGQVAPEFTKGLIVNSAEQAVVNKLGENGTVQGAASSAVGEITGGVLLGIAGDKGLSKLKTLASTIKKVDGATLNLPASMIDELPAFQKAASEGKLTKTSTKGTRSKARQIFEKEGPVPDGFDVDHIIQRQFGGTDKLSNLQLKPSSLNRSQGSKAFHLNRNTPVGAKFKKVRIIDDKK